MLRRSLFLFATLAALGLCATALFSVFGLHGPDDVLAEARLLLARDENTAAVSLLDRCEPSASMRNQPQLLRELWQLRLTAHRRLDNSQRALRDIENLLQQQADDVELLLGRIYYLARLGQGALARQRALEFLAEYPQSARALELAGEACQVDYREELQQFAVRVRSDLEARTESAGQRALLQYLYRPVGDPGVEAALQSLRFYYQRQPRLQQAWPAFQESLRALRDRIQEALGFWQRSLEVRQPAGRQANFMIAAFRGVALSMQQAGRNDDLVAQAEIYQTLYDHRYSALGAQAAAGIHLLDGLDAAAIEVADRFLHRGDLRERVATQTLDAGVQDLLLTAAIAAHRQRLLPPLDRLGADIRDLNAAGLQLPLANAATSAFTALLRNNPRAAEAGLASATNLLLRQPAPPVGDDPLDLLLPLRLSQMRTREGAMAQIVAVLDQWVLARPGAIAPLIERGRAQLELGQSPAAMTSASKILEQHPLAEEALRLLADAADRVYRESKQDGESLLERCLQRNTLRPDVQHPIAYILCAEAALRHGAAAVARDTARAAVDHFPWARWPRQLVARAEAAAGNANAAISALENAIATDPDDTESLALLQRLSRTAGTSIQPHLATLVRRGIGGEDTQLDLLRLSLAENSPSAVVLARAVAAQQEATGELLALAAQAHARAGDDRSAARLLERARQQSTDEPSAATRDALTIAHLDLLTAQARSQSDAELAAVARAGLRQWPPAGQPAADHLLRCALALESTHPATAYQFASTALALADAVESRAAAGFVLAGRLALRLGRLDAARVHWTAAISFPDGAAAAEPLARLELDVDQARARQVFALAAPATDAALAACCGDGAQALELARRAVASDPGDLLAQVTIGMLAPTGPAALGADLRASEAEIRTAAATVAALLAEPALAALALPRARELAAGTPQSPALQLLLARALIDSGQLEAGTAVHAAVHRDGCRDVVLLAEVVRTAVRANVPPAAPLAQALQEAFTAAPDRLPPAVMAFAVRSLAAQAAVGGFPDVAARILADLWLRAPEASGAVVGNAADLLANGRPQDAIVLLDHLRRTRSGSEQRRATELLFVTGIEHAPTLGEAVEFQLRRSAREELLAGRNRGAALAFACADPRRLEDVTPEQLLAWTEALLHDCATGVDHWEFARAAFQWFERQQGAAAALALVERVLAAHPGWLPLWVDRARLQAAEGRVADGLDAARAALALGDDPPTAAYFLILAAEHRSLQPADLELLRKLPAAQLESPLGRYLRGLVALRQGRGDEAEALLKLGAERPSGFHLYARALANLIRLKPDARATAAQLFEQLARDYDSSSLARYAGSFARQLAPN